MLFRFFAKASPYEIRELLSEGPLSEVYLAHRQDKEFKIPVVIKLFRQKEGALLQMESFLRVRASSHLVKVLSFEKWHSRPALVLEYIEGVNLKALTGKKPFTSEERACICTQTLMGLKELKKAGLAHGDLSLSNILINREGHIYLTDYGLANYKKEVYGTRPFTAPELYRGDPPSLASDLFSLGVLEKVLKGDIWDLSNLQSEHFLQKGDPLLDPHPAKRKEKDFPWGQKAFSSLSERVSEALFIKTCLPTSKAKKFKPDLEKSKTTWAFVSFFPVRFMFLSMLLVIFLFLTNPFVSYGKYAPEEEEGPATLLIRTQGWFYVQVAGMSGYTPLTLFVKKTGTYKLKWKKKGAEGHKYIYLKAGQKTVLQDKDFF